jgi:catechol 2,3-dioxygenase-like lactoylglutathione lyase family enzyme
MPGPPGVNFIYLYCNDLQAMRHFYSQLLGLNEIYHAAAANGAAAAVAYNCDGLQFTIFADRSAQSVPKGWARQPGWDGGTQSTISWSVCFSESEYPAVVKRLHDAGVEAYFDLPKWHGYWGYPVKDPMGNTVEVVHSPEVEPENTDWQSYHSLK